MSAGLDFPPFYLYGLAPSDAGVPASLGAMREEGVGIAVSMVAESLAMLPIASMDHTRLALLSTVQGANGLSLSMVVLNRATGQGVVQASLALPQVSNDSSLLPSAVFAADSATLCVVLSVTAPTPTGRITKTTDEGKSFDVDTATWVSHHELIYLDCASRSFEGPFDMKDAPTLARVNLGADEQTLWVWTIDEPAAVLQKKAAVELPPARLGIYPFGSNSPRRVLDADGPWPVNGEPTAPLSGGGMVRLIYGNVLQIYGTDGSPMTEVNVGPLAAIGARPSAATLDLLPDGTLFLTAPVLGAAVIVDPKDGFRVRSQANFDIPLYAGGPLRMSALSPERNLVYVCGGPGSGGLVGIDLVTGGKVVSYSDGRDYSGLHRLPDGHIVGIARSSPRVILLDADLVLQASADPDLDVVAVL